MREGPYLYNVQAGEKKGHALLLPETEGGWDPARAVHGGGLCLSAWMHAGQHVAVLTGGHDCCAWRWLPRSSSLHTVM